MWIIKITCTYSWSKTPTVMGALFSLWNIISVKECKCLDVPVGIVDSGSGSYFKPPKHCLDWVVPQHFLHKQAGVLWWKLQRGKQTLWRGYSVMELRVHQTQHIKNPGQLWPVQTQCDTKEDNVQKEPCRSTSGGCQKTWHTAQLLRGEMWKRFCSQMRPT